MHLVDGHGLRPERTIFVLDDDPEFRATFSAALSAAGHCLVAFGNGPTLLAAARKRMPLCMVIDIRQHGGAGLEVLRELQREAYPAPIFATSREGDIPTAVSALKLGAMDFIRKPLRVSELIERIDHIARSLEARNSRLLARAVQATPFPGRELLSGREIQIAELLAAGASSKEIAKLLGISPRTVDDHRYRIMRKLNVRSVADVARLVHGTILKNDFTA